VGALNITTWKNDMRKLVKYIRKSIEINANTDQLHKSRLIELCDQLDRDIKESGSINQVSVAVIEKYTKLIFQLLGNTPNHWNSRAPYHDRFWKLSGHRTLTYTQTDKQKTHMIINAIDIRKLFEISLSDHEDLHDMFYRGFNSNCREFIVWFKKKYPAVYCELF